MLKSIVISTSNTKFSALSFKEYYIDNIARISDMGFDAVELAVRDPKEIDLFELKKQLKKYKLPVVAIGTGQAYGEEGLSFTSNDDDIRRRAIQRIKEQMDFACEIGKPQIIIGLIRGTVSNGMNREKAERKFIESILECADYRPEIVMTVEAINRYETNLYNDTNSTIKIIDQIDRPNVKMLYDTFHMNIEEPNMLQAISKAKNYISHVHFADSNRWAPGCGHIDFKKIVESLRNNGYQNAISAEILPHPTPVESARLTMEYYKKLAL